MNISEFIYSIFGDYGDVGVLFCIFLIFLSQMIDIIWLGKQYIRIIFKHFYQMFRGITIGLYEF